MSTFPFTSDPDDEVHDDHFFDKRIDSVEGISKHDFDDAEADDLDERYLIREELSISQSEIEDGVYVEDDNSEDSYD